MGRQSQADLAISACALSSLGLENKRNYALGKAAVGSGRFFGVWHRSSRSAIVAIHLASLCAYGDHSLCYGIWEFAPNSDVPCRSLLIHDHPFRVGVPTFPLFDFLDSNRDSVILPEPKILVDREIYVAQALINSRMIRYAQTRPKATE